MTEPQFYCTKCAEPIHDHAGVTIHKSRVPGSHNIAEGE